MNGVPRAYYLPRLTPEFYQGDAVVHWTLTIFDRATGWLNESFPFDFENLCFMLPRVKACFVRPIA